MYTVIKELMKRKNTKRILVQFQMGFVSDMWLNTHTNVATVHVLHTLANAKFDKTTPSLTADSKY